MYTLVCQNEQALLMAVEDFNTSVGGGKNLISQKSFRLKKGLYEISITSSLTEDFKTFVESSECYKNFFRPVLRWDEVVGFRSYDSAVKSLEVFNNRNMDHYYVDPCCEIEEIKCLEGSVYIPLVESELEKIFWDYVKSNISLERTIKVGREKCQNKAWDEFCFDPENKIRLRR